MLKHITRIPALIACISLCSCAQFAAFQNQPGVAAAETAAVQIGLTLATQSPAFGFVAPIAISGLTALANGSNKTAVTGIITTDVPLITKAVVAAVPNSAGFTAAKSIAAAYVGAMTTSGMSSTPTTANAVLAALAQGLNAGAVAATPN